MVVAIDPGVGQLGGGRDGQHLGHLADHRRGRGGELASAPSWLSPLTTVSKLVPSRSIWARRLDWLERVMPRTATIEAMPIAMPSPDSRARSLRDRRPSVPVGSRSAA